MRKRPLTPKQLEALEIIRCGEFWPDIEKEDDGWHARWRPDLPWLDDMVRSASMTPLTRDAESQRHLTLHDAWIAALSSETGLIRWDDAECAAFADVLKRWHTEGGVGGADANARSAIIFKFDAGKSELSCAVPKGRMQYKALGEAVNSFGLLRGMRKRQDRLVLALERGEAEVFLIRGANELKAAGYQVEGCDLKAVVAAEAKIGEVGIRKKEEGRSAPIKLVIKVDGEPVNAEEIKFLLEQGSSLVFFRNRWIEVDRNILKQALRALEQVGQVKLSRTELMAFACGIGRIGKLEVNPATVRGTIGKLLRKFSAKREECGSDRIDGFAGELRDYQKRGVMWMRALTENGFGALLADDMGLGKTVEAIAWMLAGKHFPALVVAPLTLLSNWKHELAKFAPQLRVYVHQGENRYGSVGFRRVVGESDVVLTSYNLLVKEHRFFGDVAWGAMVLDEAQAIKNPDTAVARAVRALTPPKRIVLTGTPIENSVADLWSIEEFLNPGFLAERKDFEERFVKPLTLDPHAACAKRLARALEPFVLRREKGDEGIAAELGAKRTIREYCTLSAHGRIDYEMALEDYRASDRKRGDVFALITRLKLICDGEGKYERLKELIESILAAKESVLVFSQYAKVGREIKSRLERELGRKVYFLHGELSAHQREREISAFNAQSGSAVFVLSLKAGGFGLNLTKATHVIHYDRWWNPAVENQATDRTHRIGQDKTVFVHLMMTAGTLEEHVDDILNKKTALSGGLVKSGESFLSQMSEAQFEKAVALDE